MSRRKVGMARREFLKGLGLTAGGLALGLFDLDALADSRRHRRKIVALDPNAFVHIAEDGSVTIYCQRSEMGQGIRSSLPVVIADELGADLKNVRIAQADGDPKYGDQNTDGSASVRGFFDDMRRAGATARIMLVAAAAKRWKVPAAECEAYDNAVYHASSARRLAFGELVEDAAKLPVPTAAEIRLRPLSELRHVGGEMPFVDAPDIVAGRAIFGADIQIPGMLTAVVARPPVAGGKLVHYDAGPALAVAGVKQVVELPIPATPLAFQPLGGLAVIATNTWAAMRGRAALDIGWDAGPNGSYDSAAYAETLTSHVRTPGKVVREIGDVDSALHQAERRVQAEYYVPHLAHTPMEPPAAIARYADGRCEVWTCTQNPQGAREEVARILGIDKSKVTVHVTLLGGGFGRKSKPDYVAEAAFLSRAVGAPVRVQWTREDDVQHDYYHTVSAQRLEAGLDRHGKVTAWLHRTAFPSISSTFENGVTHPSTGELQQGVTDLALGVPNLRAETGKAPAFVRIGWLRSVCNIHHAFAVGSFLDEIAHARRMDPRDSLLDIYGPSRKITSIAELGVTKPPNYGASFERYPIDIGRVRAVIERVTELAGWDSRQQDGRALGLAFHRSFLTYVGAVLSVERDARGNLRVDEAWVVTDAGTIINPDRVRAQMEGSVIFGMSLALHGAITMHEGAVEQTNFRDYRMVRIPEAPREIHVELIPSDAPPGGVGEPGVPPIAPALCNAVFALTGQRARELPLSKLGLITPLSR